MEGSTYIPTVDGGDVYCRVIVDCDEGEWARWYEVRRLTRSSPQSTWEGREVDYEGSTGPREVVFYTTGVSWWYGELAVRLAESVVDRGEFGWEVVY